MTIQGQIHGHLIAGEWVGGSSAMDNVNPSDTNDIIGAFALGTATDVKNAIAAARAAPLARPKRRATTAVIAQAACAAAITPAGPRSARMA